MVKAYELTEDEMQLLCSIYPDGENIRSGKLLSPQKRTLAHYRSAKSYIDRTYGDISYELVSFTTVSPLFRYDEMRIKVDQNDYSVRIFGEDCECKDNIYSAFIHADYDRYLEKMLGCVGIEGKAYTVFEEFLGEEDTGSSTVWDLLGKNPKLSRQIAVFVAGSDDECTAKIEEAFCREKVYGNCCVYFVPVGEEKTAEEFMAGKDGYSYRLFNSFLND